MSEQLYELRARVWDLLNEAEAKLDDLVELVAEAYGGESPKIARARAIRDAVGDASSRLGEMFVSSKRRNVIWEAPPPAPPRKASDLLAMERQRRDRARADFLTIAGDDDKTPKWMGERASLPDWARESDDVELLDYGVDAGPFPYSEGRDGWRILRDGAVVGYAYEDIGEGLLITWSLEEPEPHDPRSYDPLP
jgi:hypothetical protein